MEHGALYAYTDARRNGRKPAEALALARAKPASCGYPNFFPACGNVSRQPKRMNYAFIEDTGVAGLRFVNFADEIAPRTIRHTGWFTNDEGNGDTYRGAVWRLNHNRGFVAGYVDPNNEGAAFVDLDIVDADDELGAALRADSIAQYEAEEARDYNRAWRAGRDFEELAEDITRARRSYLALIREAKAACKVLTDFAAIKSVVREHVESYRADIRRARDKRDRLEHDFGRAAGFRDA